MKSALPIELKKEGKGSVLDAVSNTDKPKLDAASNTDKSKYKQI
jgi:hypothetical protein